jgi:hypothetical protein
LGVALFLGRAGKAMKKIKGRRPTQKKIDGIHMLSLPL